jgi:hypothetical protein
MDSDKIRQKFPQKPQPSKSQSSTYFADVIDQKGLHKSKIDKILKEFYLLSKDTILDAGKEKWYQLERYREAISHNFYAEYMEIVFGIHPTSGVNSRGYYLLKAIKSPPHTKKDKISLFAVNFMNRLFLIKFMEDAGMVPNDIVKKMWDKFFASRKSVPGTFYKSLLEPLFFEVFNTPLCERDPHIKEDLYCNKVPYVDGGLFQTIENEKEFDIEDEIVRIIIHFIGKYSFTLSGGGLDPDILGNVFEKTINYIAIPGSDAQKAKGAYYTPDDVVTFMIKRALSLYVLANLRKASPKRKWKSDLKKCTTLESLLSVCKTKEDIKKVLDIVDSVLILDPACGSGHFLIAALKELVFLKRRLLDEIGEEYDLYTLKREIINQNLFGVDMEGPAIEIAKVRLWLNLMEELSNPQHNKSVPTIEYTICQGDSLKGWIDEPINQKMLTTLYNDKEIQTIVQGLKTVYKNHATLATITESLNSSNVDTILRAYTSLKNIYKSESKKRAATLKPLLEKIQEKIYAFVTKEYDLYLGTTGVMCAEDVKRFHWGINFYDIIKKGGFDIVIGNPPYIEVPQSKRNHLRYYTKECGNTYAYFYERSLRLAKRGGICGLIVPVSSVSTDRMRGLQTLLMKESSHLWISNYDDRPGKLFRDLEHCRSSIIISQKRSNDEPLRIFTTSYKRWYSENRGILFKDTTYVESTNFVLNGSILKIGSHFEKSILTKMKKDKKLIHYLYKKGEPLWYHNAPQYWIRALDFVPYFWNERDGQKISSHLVALGVQPVYKKIVGAVLNSSLFYWFFVIHSNGRDLVKREIENFPLSMEKIPFTLVKNLEKVFDDLMEEYKRNTERKECYYKTTGKVEYDEFQPGLSKEIIDTIDDLFAEYYGFSDEERDFIKNFDSNMRMKS